MYPEPSTADVLTREAAAASKKALTRIKKEGRDLGINTPGLADLFAFGDGGGTITGVHISQEKSLQLSAVYACVTFIADYVASLPKFPYERLQKGKKRAVNHWLYPLIHDNPNPYMNDYEFTECLTGHVLLWGNAFAEVVRNGAGEVIELWPLRPDRMRIEIYQGQIYYYYTMPDSSERQLSPQKVFHLRGLGSDGITGYSPINLHREAIALGFAEQEYRSRFFNNNASPGGVLESDRVVSEPAQQRLKKNWQEAHSGLSNSHRVAILEEGLKWQQIGLPAKDVEFIEGRKYQRKEIASIYRVKPYKVGEVEPGTVSFASIEQQALDTHIDTMRPWVIRWEKKFTSLLSQADRRKYFVEFLFDAVLRADSESRARTLQIWRMNGLINADGWLDLENRNPLPEGKGEDYWRPANMTVVGQEPPPAPVPEPIPPARDLLPHPVSEGYTNGAAK